ncbi:MAG TPA: hypothetical protein VKI00_33620 [Mycobacterium sp.]|nr:hypothetical protein [Mycobacterium sp.]HME80433.1 hypothetical protein [Mycobacterium sp.]
MNTDDQVKRPRAAKLARKLAVPIVLFWVLAAWCQVIPQCRSRRRR